MSAFTNIITSGKPVLVDFFAEWCGPCKMMSPILKQLKEEMGDSVTIIKVDVDKNPGTAGSYNVQGVPTLILFKDGKVVEQLIGVQPKESIKRKIDTVVT